MMNFTTDGTQILVLQLHGSRGVARRGLTIALYNPPKALICGHLCNLWSRSVAQRPTTQAALCAPLCTLRFNPSRSNLICEKSVVIRVICGSSRRLATYNTSNPLCTPRFDQIRPDRRSQTIITAIAAAHSPHQQARSPFPSRQRFRSPPPGGSRGLLGGRYRRPPRLYPPGGASPR